MNKLIKIRKIDWKGKATEEDYILAIIIATIIVMVFFVYVNFLPKPLFKKKISVDIIEIIGDCDVCMELGSAVETLIKENENVGVNKEILDYNSEEAKSLIEDYDVKRVPAIIVKSKNINQLDLDQQLFFVKDDSAVFDKGVPYIDLSDGEIKGLVDLKEIQDSSCIDCMPLSQLKTQFERMGIKVSDYEVIDSSFKNGKTIIKENDLNFLPSLLISKNIEEYWWVFSQVKNSFVEKEDYYIFKNPIPPYKDISTGKVKGKVDITYLTDDSCGDCFNVTLLKDSFLNIGVFINNEKYIDIDNSGGKQLIEKYDIKAVPTVILSEEISDYESIKEILKQLGTFENREFVFRKLDGLNVNYQEI